jgi:hypothetical protein
VPRVGSPGAQCEVTRSRRGLEGQVRDWGFCAGSRLRSPGNFEQERDQISCGFGNLSQAVMLT